MRLPRIPTDQFVAIVVITAAAGCVFYVASMPPEPPAPEPLCMRGAEMKAAMGGTVSDEAILASGACDPELAQRNLDLLRNR